MNKSIRWLILGFCLILLGAILFTVAMTANHWDFEKLNTKTLVTNEYTISEDVICIRVLTDTADVVLLPTDGTSYRVVCEEYEPSSHTVTAMQGTLTVEIADQRKWYDHIGIGMDKAKITIYVPVSAYLLLSVETDTGDITVPADFTFESITLSTDTGDMTLGASASTVRLNTSTGDVLAEHIRASHFSCQTTTGDVTVTDAVVEASVGVNVSTGRVRLTDVSCHDLYSTGDTGDLTMSRVVAEESFSIHRSTGDVRFDRCDASNISVTTDTGDVTGTLCSDKVFEVETDTGRKQVPASRGEDRCRITTDTGDVKLRIEQ